MLLSEKQIDVFQELINIGVGKSASFLNELVSSHIKLNIPKIWVKTLKEIRTQFSEEFISQLYAVKLKFEGSFSGVAEIVFPSDSAQNLVSLLTGEEKYSPELDIVRAGTLNEVANVLLNGVMGTIGNLLNDSFEYSLPTYIEGDLKNILDIVNDETVVILFGESHFIVEEYDIEGDIILVMELPSFKNLKSALDRLLDGK